MKPIKKRELVLVLPDKRFTKEVSWGVVEEIFPESQFLKVTTGEKDGEFVVCPKESIIPLFWVEEKEPQKALKKNRFRVLAWVIEKLAEKTEKSNPFGVDISKNTLVVVKAKLDKPPRTCLGLVVKKAIGKKDYYDIKIGFRERIIVPSSQLIPVIQTVGSIKRPVTIAKNNIDEILIKIILRLSINENRQALKVLESAFENIIA